MAPCRRMLGAVGTGLVSRQVPTVAGGGEGGMPNTVPYAVPDAVRTGRADFRPWIEQKSGIVGSFACVIPGAASGRNP